MVLLDVLILIRHCLLNRRIVDDNWEHSLNSWLVNEFGHQYLPENYHHEPTLCMVLRSLGSLSVYDEVRGKP